MINASKDTGVSDTPTADSTYYVGTHDWPTGSASGVPVNKIFEIIGRFDDYYRSAVEGLASTVVPTGDSSKTD